MKKRIAHYAVFADGTSIKRLSQREFTHAYRWEGQRRDDDTVFGGSGFCTSKLMAEKTAAVESRQYRNVQIEIVEATTK